MERFESYLGASLTFDAPMVLFNDVVHVFTLPGDDRGFINFIVLNDCCQVYSTLVDVDQFRLST